MRERCFHTMFAMNTLASRALPTPALSGLLLTCLAATWLVWGSTYLAIKFALLSFPPFFQAGAKHHFHR